MPLSPSHRSTRLARVRRTGAPVLAALTVAAGLATPAATPSAEAALGSSVTVRGHGFGHGHGMSQYGAYGAARQGLGYRRIVGFYYPGTGWGEVRGLVRVLLTADTTTDVVVGPTPGLRLRDLGAGRTYPLPDNGATRWKLDVAGDDSVVAYLQGGTWRRWSPGGRGTLVGDGQFRADGPITLYTPGGSQTYRGRLRAASPAPGSSLRDTVNVVSMDTYVRGVIPAEMPASWPAEAVKAQAVAARTYATWSRDQYPDRHWQICDTTSCQVYRGVGGEHELGDSAVLATSRQILTYGGSAAFTQFSASSGGWTSAGSRPYLVAKADPYDGHSGNPVHSWSTSVSRARIESAYPRIGRLDAIRVLRRDGNGEWSGRVLSMRLVGSRESVTISGDTFRSVAGLRSTWFTVS